MFLWNLLFLATQVIPIAIGYLFVFLSPLDNKRKFVLLNL